MHRYEDAYWSIINLLGTTLLKKRLSLLPEAILLPIAPLLRVETPEPLPNVVLRADWVDTVQV